MLLCHEVAVTTITTRHGLIEAWIVILRMSLSKRDTSHLEVTHITIPALDPVLDLLLWLRICTAKVWIFYIEFTDHPLTELQMSPPLSRLATVTLPTLPTTSKFQLDPTETTISPSGLSAFGPGRTPKVQTACRYHKALSSPRKIYFHDCTQVPHENSAKRPYMTAPRLSQTPPRRQ